jgi:hypothetical protein
MNYGYQQFGSQGFGSGPAMMPGTGFGAAMPQPNFVNTTAEVEAQRRRLKALGLDDTMIDDALKMKEGLFQKRDEMRSGVQESAMGAIGDGIKSAGSNLTGAAAKSGISGLMSSL